MDKEKMEQMEGKVDVDRFKDVFKYYKRRQPPPDLSQAIDVDSLSEVTVVPPPKVSEEDRRAAQVSGLTPPHTWTIHSLVKHPGLLVVRNPFTRAGQLAWVKRCLCELPCATNKTNLASHGIHLSEERTWWRLCRMSEGQRSGLRHKLRWVTLGYHHDWDTKEYSEDSRGEVPGCLVMLCGVVARVLGVGMFQAQAAIINYYPPHATLGPHTDHSEPYATAPLLSFSFGQSAIFLIGGPTKASEPSAVMVHSGDIVVMSGHSRLCYHAVPRILAREEWRRARKKRRRKGEDEAEEEEVVDEEEPWTTELSSHKVRNKTEKENMKRKKKETEEDKKRKEDEKGKGEERKENERRKDEERMEVEKKNENKIELSTHKHGNKAEEKKIKENEVMQREDKEKKENEECLEKELIKEKKNEGEEDEPEEPKKRRKMEEKQTKLRNEEKVNNDNDDDDKGSDNGKNNNDNDGDTGGNDNGDNDDNGDEDDLADILEYLRTCRINMNVRQVLPPSMDSLPS